jgi:hypothetical protein
MLDPESSPTEKHGGVCFDEDNNKNNNCVSPLAEVPMLHEYSVAITDQCHLLLRNICLSRSQHDSEVQVLMLGRSSWMVDGCVASDPGRVSMQWLLEHLPHIISHHSTHLPTSTQQAASGRPVFSLFPFLFHFSWRLDTRQNHRQAVQKCFHPSCAVHDPPDVASKAWTTTAALALPLALPLHLPATPRHPSLRQDRDESPRPILPKTMTMRPKMISRALVPLRDS